MSRPTTPSLTLLASLAAVALFAAGCGGKRQSATVSGKVTLAGKGPLPGGNITFALASDPTQVSGAVIKSDGTFEARDVPVGECKVAVDNTNLDLSSKSAGLPGMGAPTGMPGMPGMPGKGGPTSAPPPAAKGKMGGAPKGLGVDSEMEAGKDTGAKKYVKLDVSFIKTDTSSLRYTVKGGENKDANFDVK